MPSTKQVTGRSADANEQLRALIRDDLKAMLKETFQTNVAKQGHAPPSMSELRAWNVRQEELLMQLLDQQRLIKQELRKIQRAPQMQKEGSKGTCDSDKGLWTGDSDPLPIHLTEGLHQKADLDDHLPPTLPSTTETKGPPVTGKILGKDASNIDCEMEESTATPPRSKSTRLRTTSRLGRFIEGMPFQVWCASVIIANAVFLGFSTGYQVEYAINNIGSKTTPNNELIKIFDAMFVAFYFAELTLKLIHFKLKFFTGSDAAWNIFDVFILFMSILELTSFFQVNFAWLRLLNVFKQIVKALRVLKVVKFFRELRVIIMSIAYSLQSFVWAMLTISLIMYMCAIVFVQGITHMLLQADPKILSQSIQTSATKYWGSVSRAMLSEFKSVTGGSPWWLFAEPLEQAGDVYLYMFIAYISLLAVAVLKMLTGIFVQTANKASEADHIHAIQQNMRVLFDQIDSDHSGSVSSSEFQQCINQKAASKFLESLHINPAHTSKLFKMMDEQGDDKVDVDEFLVACQNFGGWAKNVDMVFLSDKLNDMYSQMGHFMAYVEESLEHTMGRASEPPSKSLTHRLKRNPKTFQSQGSKF